jgi:hypothetical protein
MGFYLLAFSVVALRALQTGELTTLSNMEGFINKYKYVSKSFFIYKSLIFT